MESSNLPPIDFTEDVKKYEAKAESKEVRFNQCNHKNVTYQDGQIRCKCGAGWTGNRLDELMKVLTS